MTWKDKIAVFLAACLLALTAFQGVASALPGLPPQISPAACSILVDKNPVTGRNGERGRNPLVLDPRKGDYAVAFGDGTVTCKRTAAAHKHHNRIYTSAVIEKWRPQFKKYFTYRTYAYSHAWNAKHPEMVVFPAASIICDGHGHYRVRVQAWSADTSYPIQAYPSKFVEKASEKVGICIGTNHKSIAVANNP